MTARTCVVSNRWSGPHGAPSTWNGCNPVSIKYSRNPEDARERDRGRGWGGTSNYDCSSTTPCTQLHAPCSDAVRTPYCTDHVRFGFALLVADHKETLSSTPPIAKHSPSGDHAQACACNNDDINTARVSITGRQQAAARERTLLVSEYSLHQRCRADSRLRMGWCRPAVMFLMWMVRSPLPLRVFHIRTVPSSV